MAKPNITGRELAIAGSIILVVGIALVVTIPIFSMNHRNSERIRDMNLIADSLVEWQENHRGELPDSEELTTATGLGGLTDPDGTTYTYVLNNRAGKATTDTMTLKRESALNHKVYVYYSATCSGNFPVPVGNQQKFAVFYKLEGGSSIYCVDNDTQ